MQSYCVSALFIILIGFLGLSVGLASEAAASSGAPAESASGSESSTFFKAFENRYSVSPEKPRRGLSPIFSLFLPGLDQFAEENPVAGAVYTGYAVAGLSLFSSASENVSEGSTERDDIGARNNHMRQAFLGLQMYQVAGSLSAYQAYRSHIQVYRDLGGGYDFIKTGDRTVDIAWAPFEFHFLLKPTTYVPLGLLLAGMVYAVRNTEGADFYLNDSDVGYASAFSYQAGVGEEALFRGWLMPSFRHSWGSDFWSNAMQATLFSLAHISDENRYPIWQLGVGYYLGWLTQRNGWSVREATFIHVWWDVIAFTGSYLADSKADRQAFLPLLSTTW